MMAASDEEFLNRAIALAKAGRGITEPNPSVGCVLVKDGIVIGEGRTQAPGGAHGEPTAIADARARGNDPRGATAYVTLEPCCHTNKRTPPCVPTLIAAGVSRVVIGCLDPNPDVNGRGIAQLRAAGIDVTTGVLEAPCRQLIAPFIARTLHARPYVTLKWAESADGFMAGTAGERRQISGPEASAVVHLLRARSDAILVGGETVRRDDPLLTARADGPKRKLLRAVISRRHALPGNSKLLNTPDQGEVVVYRGGFAGMMADLCSRGITHLMVESAGALASELMAANLVDRVWRLRSSAAMGEGLPAVRLEPGNRWVSTVTAAVGKDVITEYLNARSPVFFEPAPSADAEQLLS